MEQVKRGCFDEIELDIDELVKTNIGDYFALQDIRNRKLFLNDEINPDTVADIARWIMQYNKDDKGLPADERTPILLYIVSSGGYVSSGFELIDLIHTSITPVYTINLAYWYSMGFLVGISGHKRFANKNAWFLMHDGSTCVYNSGSKVQDQMEFNKKVEDRIREHVISHSNITEEEYADKLRVEWYMLSAEAKEKGFIDYIIGEDCTLDEVI